jgi:hypothetical protein
MNLVGIAIVQAILISLQALQDSLVAWKQGFHVKSFLTKHYRPHKPLFNPCFNTCYMHTGLLFVSLSVLNTHQRSTRISALGGSGIFKRPRSCGWTVA